LTCAHSNYTWHTANCTLLNVVGTYKVNCCILRVTAVSLKRVVDSAEFFFAGLLQNSFHVITDFE